MRITVSSRVRLNHILQLLFLLHSIDDGKEDFFLMDVVDSGYMCVQGEMPVLS